MFDNVGTLKKGINRLIGKMCESSEAFHKIICLHGLRFLIHEARHLFSGNVENSASLSWWESLATSEVFCQSEDALALERYIHIRFFIITNSVLNITTERFLWQ